MPWLIVFRACSLNKDQAALVRRGQFSCEAYAGSTDAELGPQVCPVCVNVCVSVLPVCREGASVGYISAHARGVDAAASGVSCPFLRATRTSSEHSEPSEVDRL